MYSVNPLYLIFDDANGYFEEINGNKYLTLVPINDRLSQNLKEVPKNFTEVLILMSSQLVTSCGETNIEKKKVNLCPRVISDVNLAS